MIVLCLRAICDSVPVEKENDQQENRDPTNRGSEKKDENRYYRAHAASLRYFSWTTSGGFESFDWIVNVLTPITVTNVLIRDA